MSNVHVKKIIKRKVAAVIFYKTRLVLQHFLCQIGDFRANLRKLGKFGVEMDFPEATAAIKKRILRFAYSQLGYFLDLLECKRHNRGAIFLHVCADFCRIERVEAAIKAKNIFFREKCTILNGEQV